MDRNVFNKIYWKIQSIVVPGLKYSQDIYEEVLNEHVSTTNWLDLGCGHQILPLWRHEQEKMLISKSKLIVGIDFDYLSITKHQTINNKLRGDITNLPFLDNTFDLVTSNMVFEHLDNPERQLKEICRVLSKGGKLIFHTPNKFDYATLLARVIPETFKARLVYFLQGVKEEDVFPAHYRINSTSEIRKIAIDSGFVVSEIKMICSSAQFIVLPPIVIFELIWIRFLILNSLRYNFSNSFYLLLPSFFCFTSTIHH